MELPAQVTRHPYLFGGGAAALVLLFMFSGGKKSAPTSTAVVSTGLDPVAASLAQNQQAINAGLASKQIDAQTQIAGLDALGRIQASNNAAQMHVADITANVANTKTIASIFGTAVSGLTANSNMATSGQVPSGDFTSGVANGTALVPGGVGWQPWMDAVAHSGNPVPIISATGSSGQATDATNNQISELFNNVIRAAQGHAPLQTVTMQDNGPTFQQTGTATIDPVFAVWDGSSAVPTITDVTLNPNSQYGYTGSVYTPGSAAAVNITPDAIKAPPPPAAAQLPQFNWGNFGF